LRTAIAEAVVLQGFERIPFLEPAFFATIWAFDGIDNFGAAETFDITDVGFAAFPDIRFGRGYETLLS
jgi:hypothetical protein